MHRGPFAPHPLDYIIFCRTQSFLLIQSTRLSATRKVYTTLLILYLLSRNSAWFQIDVLDVECLVNLKHLGLSALL